MKKLVIFVVPIFMGMNVFGQNDQSAKKTVSQDTTLVYKKSKLLPSIFFGGLAAGFASGYLFKGHEGHPGVKGDREGAMGSNGFMGLTGSNGFEGVKGSMGSNGLDGFKEIKGFIKIERSKRHK